MLNRTAQIVCLGTILILSTFSFSAQAEKLSKKERAKFAKPLPLLTFREMGNLSLSARIRYLKALNKALHTAEHTQTKMLNSPFRGAQIYRPEQDDWYKLLIGDFANASEKCANTCIESGRASCYPDANSSDRQNFRCKVVEFCGGPKDTGRLTGGKGVQCDPLTMIPYNRGEGCIPLSDKGFSTINCEKKRKQLAEDNAQLVNDVITNVDDYFKKIRKEDFGSVAANQAFENLAAVSYDYRAKARLIYILDLYRKNGKSPSVETLKKYFNVNSLAELESNWNDSQIAVNDIYRETVENTCERRLTENDITNLTTGASTTAANQASPTAQKLEGIRVGTNSAFAEQDPDVRQATYLRFLNTIIRPIIGSSYDAIDHLNLLGPAKLKARTRENSLEIQECYTIKKSREELKSAFDEVINSYPVIADGQTDTPPPIALPEAKVSYVSSGCQMSYSREEHMLYQAAARCTMCLGQKAVERSIDNLPLEMDKEFAESFLPSTKWQSLLGTMALACKDTYAQSGIDAQIMLQYQETFGQCDSESTEYDWGHAETLSTGDKSLIESWANYNFWECGKKSKDPKCANHPAIAGSAGASGFKRIYGVEFAEAKSMFCDGTRALLNNRENNPSFTANRRKHFENMRKKMHDPSSAFYRCADQALELAKAIYKEGSPSQKMKIKEAGPSLSKLMTEASCSLENNTPLILFSGSDCLTTHQIEIVNENFTLKNGAERRKGDRALLFVRSNLPGKLARFFEDRAVDEFDGRLVDKGGTISPTPINIPIKYKLAYLSQYTCAPTTPPGQRNGNSNDNSK